MPSNESSDRMSKIITYDSIEPISNTPEPSLLTFSSTPVGAGIKSSGLALVLFSNSDESGISADGCEVIMGPAMLGSRSLALLFSRLNWLIVSKVGLLWVGRTGALLTALSCTTEGRVDSTGVSVTIGLSLTAGVSAAGFSTLAATGWGAAGAGAGLAADLLTDRKSVV